MQPSEHRARILRPDSAEDRAEIEAIRSDPRTQLFDTLEDQVRELMSTRNPANELTEEQLQALLAEHVAGGALEGIGVWVHYPWSHRLVHLLDEAEFAELRTDRNRCKITAEEQARLAQWKVGVVGLSVGQSVAATMALERGFGEIRLVDFDLLELSNLNRVRAGVHTLGLPKAIVAAREIAEIDPFLKVTCIQGRLGEDNVEQFLDEGGTLDLVIDECDSLDVKVMLRAECRRRGIPVLMDTSDRGLVDVERFDLEPQRPLFHGLVDDLTPEKLRGLCTEDKIPYVLRIVGQETVSTRSAASMLEVGRSIKTWPQLASSVVLGGASAADVSRRICLAQPVASGRYFVDLEQLVGGAEAGRAQPTSQEPLIAPAIEPRRLRELPRSADAERLDRATLHRLLSAASIAPSGGNLQPWQWVQDGSLLSLHLDRSRCSAQLDPRGDAGFLSLGAATENLVLAAHAEGLAVRVHEFPNPELADCVASFEFFEDGAAGNQSPAHDALHAHIAERHTNRRNAERRPIASDAASALTSAVASVHGAALTLVTDPAALDEIGRLLGAGDRLRILDPALGAELVTELRWTSEEASRRRDGIAVDTLELRPAEQAGLAICRRRDAMDLTRSWGGGARLEEGSQKAIAGSSAVAMITMPGDDPEHYFQGGRAVQRAWLEATRLGLAVHPMTALPYLFARLTRGDEGALHVETIRGLRELRSRYLEAFELDGRASEIMLFRIAHAEATSMRALRRPVEEVLTVLEARHDLSM